MTINYERIEYYKCYSINLKNWIAVHNIYPLSSGVHPITNKVYYVYEITDELSLVLTAWTNNKNKEK